MAGNPQSESESDYLTTEKLEQLNSYFCCIKTQVERMAVEYKTEVGTEKNKRCLSHSTPDVGSDAPFCCLPEEWDWRRAKAAFPLFRNIRDFEIFPKTWQHFCRCTLFSHVNTILGHGLHDADTLIISLTDKYKHFSTPLAPLSGLAHTSTPQVLLTVISLVCWRVGNTHIDSCARLVLLRKKHLDLLIFHHLIKHSQHCTGHHHCCIIHSLELSNPALSSSLVLPKEQYRKEKNPWVIQIKCYREVRRNVSCCV